MVRPESEGALIKGPLGPPADIKLPATPHAARAGDSSPRRVRSSSTATTTSSQRRRVSTPIAHASPDDNPFASPPSTMEQTLCAAYGASDDLPTIRELNDADESALRKYARDLLGIAQENRVSASHFKLQNSLLSMTNSDALKRAEVEQQLARREIEILQSDEYRNRRLSPVKSSLPQQMQLDVAFRHIKNLEEDNMTLEKKLHQAKRLITKEGERCELLTEENLRLKKRIRDNREHFSQMLDDSPRATPRPEFLTPQRKTSRSQVHGVGHSPFAALLAADQVLSQESRAAPIQPHHGHTRQTHSLSSLPITPSQAHAAGSSVQSFTPANKRTQNTNVNLSLPKIAEGRHSLLGRRDRDSTLSASDTDEVEATTNPYVSNEHLSSANQHEIAVPPSTKRSSALLQTTLFGHVTKAGVSRPGPLKRKASDDNAIFKKPREIKP